MKGLRIAAREARFKLRTTPASGHTKTLRIEYRQDMPSDEFKEYVLQQCEGALKRLGK